MRKNYYHFIHQEIVHNPKWKNGFLGSLRPFCGELREENFVEVMECLKALKDEFSSAAIEKEIIADIIAITHLAREWAAPDGMLGS